MLKCAMCSSEGRIVVGFSLNICSLNALQSTALHSSDNGFRKERQRKLGERERERGKKSGNEKKTRKRVREREKVTSCKQM